MSLALVATVGSASANSYVTMAEADAFLEAESTEWEDYEPTDADEDGDDTKLRKLIVASREVTKLAYQGYRASNTQALAWPRFNAPKPDGSGYEYFGTSEIPQAVKDAVCLLALESLRVHPVDIFALDTKANIIEETTGPLSTTWADPSQRVQGIARYSSAWKLLAPLLGTMSGQVRLVR